MRPRVLRTSQGAAPIVVKIAGIHAAKVAVVVEVSATVPVVGAASVPVDLVETVEDSAEVVASVALAARCSMRCAPNVEKRLRSLSSPADLVPFTAEIVSRPIAPHVVAAVGEAAAVSTAAAETVVPAVTNLSLTATAKTARAENLTGLFLFVNAIQNYLGLLEGAGFGGMGSALRAGMGSPDFGWTFEVSRISTLTG